MATSFWGLGVLGGSWFLLGAVVNAKGDADLDQKLKDRCVEASNCRPEPCRCDQGRIAGAPR